VTLGRLRKPLRRR